MFATAKGTMVPEGRVTMVPEERLIPAQEAPHMTDLAGDAIPALGVLNTMDPEGQNIRVQVVRVTMGRAVPHTMDLVAPPMMAPVAHAIQVLVGLVIRDQVELVEIVHRFANDGT